MLWRRKGIFILCVVFISAFLTSCASDLNKRGSVAITTQSGGIKKIDPVIKEEPLKADAEKIDEPNTIKPSGFLKAGDKFIVDSIVWEKAFITNFIGGTKNAVVGFSGVSEATIYSPIDGYVRFYEGGNDPSGAGNMLVVASTASWSPDQSQNGEGDKAMFFFSYGIEPLVFDKVKKGDPIGKFTSNKSVMANLLADKAEIVISPDAKWGEAITSDDPIDYVKQMIDLMN